MTHPKIIIAGAGAAGILVLDDPVVEFDNAISGVIEPIARREFPLLSLDSPRDYLEGPDPIHKGMAKFKFEGAHRSKYRGKKR